MAGLGEEAGGVSGPGDKAIGTGVLLLFFKPKSTPVYKRTDKVPLSTTIPNISKICPKYSNHFTVKSAFTSHLPHKTSLIYLQKSE
jgi:hypothetical protein